MGTEPNDTSGKVPELGIRVMPDLNPSRETHCPGCGIS
jgi:hypothetical protein